MAKTQKIGHNQFIKSALGLLFSFAGGFVFSGSNIAGIASFADISLAGAVNLPCAVAVLIGGIVRCVVNDLVGRSIVKLGAMSVIVIAKMFSEKCSTPKGCGIVTLASVMIAGTAVSVLINEFPQKLLFYALYGTISGFTAYSASGLISDLQERKVVDLNGANGCTYSIVYIVYIASLCSMEFSSINAGIIIASGITLMSAFYYHSIGGIVCGALSACGAFFVSPELGMTAAMLPVAGLITGFIRIRRIFLTSVFFTLSCFMIAVLIGSSVSAELTLSIVCGASLFVITAPYYSDKWVSVGGEKTAESPDINSIKMNFLSDAIEAVRLDSAKISAVLASGKDVIPKAVNPRKRVCSSCYRRSICGAETETAGEMIPVLPGDCIKKRDVAEELENDIRNRTAEQLMKLRFSEERELLNEQLKITGEIVRSAGEKPDIRYSGAKSRQIAKNLENHGMNPSNVTAYYNSANRLIVEIYFSVDEIPESRTRICDLISDELEMNFSVAVPVSSAKEMRICLYENPPYEIEVYSASVCSPESKISGDSSAVFADGTGVNYIVLSDGMGSGKNAAIDSHLVIGMFRRLICGGMSCSSAIRLVNSIMVTKSREESFATLDAVKIDLDTCNMTSIKSGAAATIIRKGDDVIKISSPTFPIGISKQAELYTSENELGEGDMIIMFSDGISENAYLFIKELLLSGSSIRDIVREITEKADVFNPSLHSDDITVIGIRIRSAES
ncbi:MAG: SpoIIE family protein phosphatase [Ruminococcus flavefaciens]|nr:SpoIIE family protein phosphatase [Ruminococcus flavefaciens]MCM1229318.1 SpoIIE family protein phosphatase [Ruminococcus flavefaciens]